MDILSIEFFFLRNNYGVSNINIRVVILDSRLFFIYYVISENGKLYIMLIGSLLFFINMFLFFGF